MYATAVDDRRLRPSPSDWRHAPARGRQVRRAFQLVCTATRPPDGWLPYGVSGAAAARAPRRWGSSDRNREYVFDIGPYPMADAKLRVGGGPGCAWSVRPFG